MPYTFSHAVVSLPVSLASRGKIPIAAIAVGSMSPDFPYLLALTPTEAPGHSILGILLYCFVPSLALLALWYRFIEKPTLSFLHLPQRAESPNSTPRMAMVLGVLIGAYSHVLWDATSHSYGAFFVNSAFWHREVFSLPLYKWNQYGSGIAGLAILLVWYIYTVANTCDKTYRGHFWTGIIIYTACISSFVIFANVFHESARLSEFAVHTAIGVIDGGIVGACLYAIWGQIKEPISAVFSQKKSKKKRSKT